MALPEPSIQLFFMSHAVIIVSEKSTIVTFSYGKANFSKFELITYTIFVELESPMRSVTQCSPMLHAKFQDHRTPDSKEEDLQRFLSYMDMAAILVMRPGPFIQTFVLPSRESSTGNLALISQAVSEDKMSEIVDDHDDKDDKKHGYTISSPCVHNGSGELKKTVLYTLGHKLLYTLYIRGGIKKFVHICYNFLMT